MQQTTSWQCQVQSLGHRLRYQVMHVSLLTGHLEPYEQMGTISTQPLPAFGLPKVGRTLFLNLVWLASNI